jgi:predicted nucleic acid-binding Zn ribbon protein
MALSGLNTNLRRVLYKIGGEKHERFISLYLAWKSVVGELLAERSHPIKIEQNTLFVGVENSAWMQELVLLKPKILQKYKNAYHEELQDMVLIIKSKGKRKR